MSVRPVYLGIDLGTTNSAAAVFDGEAVTSIRTAEGGVLTPSVVRIDRRGNVVVGAKARRLLESDPENTCAEFKRLMGTEHRFDFRASGVARTAQELSSLVLGSLRADIESQLGVAPPKAVVSVPALFELPQTSATSEAARLAGFEQIEMIQEPVASALASGWQQQEDTGAWLVYDLGGGTFDVSLLESREGLLRVAGHDGDNFLGGRDFDASIVNWMIESLAQSGGPRIERKDPAHALVVRRLRLLAEEAKIELTRSPSASIVCPNLDVAGEGCDVDLELNRTTLERLIEPLVERTLAVCQRLLVSKGIEPSLLSRIVLVGGPTVIPYVRRRIAEVLRAPIAPDIDPMTVVAQGAALFAAAANLDARPRPAPAPVTGVSIWLQHPAMTSDLTPFLVGKLLGDPKGVDAVQIRRGDGEWSSAPERLGADATFATMLSLQPRVANTFSIEGLSGSRPVPLSPATFSIIHGVALGEPPLSRSIGVALANNSVQVYAERGAPLPLRRTFTHRTVESAVPGIPGHALRIPIVQGEFPWAHLCRVVGVLELPSSALNAALPVDSAVDVTLELDRGGRLAARAHVPHLKQTFDQVARLVIAGSTPEEIEASVGAAAQRLLEVRTSAFRDRDAQSLKQLNDIELSLDDARTLAAAARGGDADAAQRARRLVIEVAAVLDEADASRAWPELVHRVDEQRAGALSWLGLYGTEQERASAERICPLLDRALLARNAKEVDRQLGTLMRLGEAAFFRHPEAWLWVFTDVASRVSEATDLKRATALVDQGRLAADKGDVSALERAVRQLWTLMPVDVEDRQLGHFSGVR